MKIYRCIKCIIIINIYLLSNNSKNHTVLKQFLNGVTYITFFFFETTKLSYFNTISLRIIFSRNADWRKRINNTNCIIWNVIHLSVFIWHVCTQFATTPVYCPILIYNCTHPFTINVKPILHKVTNTLLHILLHRKQYTEWFLNVYKTHPIYMRQHTTCTLLHFSAVYGVFDIVVDFPVDVVYIHVHRMTGIIMFNAFWRIINQQNDVCRSSIMCMCIITLNNTKQ